MRLSDTLHTLCKLIPPMTNITFSQGTTEFDNFVEMVRYEIGRNMQGVGAQRKNIENVV